MVEMDRSKSPTRRIANLQSSGNGSKFDIHQPQGGTARRVVRPGSSISRRALAPVFALNVLSRNRGYALRLMIGQFFLERFQTAQAMDR